MGKIAFMYPGQGAQKIGMAKSFYEGSEKAKAVFDMANEALDFSLTDICFKENEFINETQYTQPALVTACLAMTEEVMERGVYPDVSLGLSLGEYAAIAVAGGFSNEVAITAVRARGIYMSEACPSGTGAMYAVLGLKAEEVEMAIENLQNVYIANYNCPGQIVITGEKKAVEGAVPVLTGAGAKKCIPLKVSGPFHSPLLKAAGDQLENYLKNVDIEELKIPYVTNVTGDYVREQSKVKELLRQQLSSSVRFEQSIRRLIEDGVDTFIEIGPGKTLAGFVKKIDRDVTILNIETMDDLDKLNDLQI